MVNKPLIRPYFWGRYVRGGRLTSHEVCQYVNKCYNFNSKLLQGLLCSALCFGISYLLLLYIAWAFAVASPLRVPSIITSSGGFPNWAPITGDGEKKPPIQQPLWKDGCFVVSGVYIFFLCRCCVRVIFVSAFCLLELSIYIEENCLKWGVIMIHDTVDGRNPAPVDR